MTNNGRQSDGEVAFYFLLLAASIFGIGWNFSIGFHSNTMPERCDIACSRHTEGLTIDHEWQDNTHYCTCDDGTVFHIVTQSTKIRSANNSH